MKWKSHDVERNICVDDKLLLEAAIKAATAAKATIINTMRYQFGHDSPPGCSVIIMLDESHISIHTYADQKMMAIDVFTCGKIIAEQVILSLKESLSLNSCIEHRLDRFVDETSKAEENLKDQSPIKGKQTAGHSGNTKTKTATS